MVRLTIVTVTGSSNVSWPEYTLVLVSAGCSVRLAVEALLPILPIGAAAGCEDDGDDAAAAACAGCVVLTVVDCPVRSKSGSM